MSLLSLFWQCKHRTGQIVGKRAPSRTLLVLLVDERQHAFLFAMNDCALAVLVAHFLTWRGGSRALRPDIVDLEIYIVVDLLKERVIEFNSQVRGPDESLH